MLDKLTHEDFAAHLTENFVIHVESAPDIVLRLDQVIPLPQPNNPRAYRKNPYSLRFTGPRELYLPQQIYPLENEGMGTLDIFIVPIGVDENGLHYEAIFN